MKIIHIGTSDNLEKILNEYKIVPGFIGECAGISHTKCEDWVTNKENTMFFDSHQTAWFYIEAILEHEKECPARGIGD